MLEFPHLSVNLKLLMNRITVLLIAILSIMNIARPALAQEIYAPVPQPAVILERSGAQKLVGTTTDITAVALPVATLVGVLLTGDWEGLRQGIYTAVAGVSAVYILKFSVREKRPDGSNYSSFPSMHSATAFGSAAFLQRRYGWKFGAPAYALAAYTAVGRVVAKKHFWWDCVAGAAIGAASAYIFTTPWARRHELAVAPTATETSTGIVASFSF